MCERETVCEYVCEVFRSRSRQLEKNGVSGPREQPQGGEQADSRGI